MKNKTLKVSIVIPTLGSKKLLKTVKTLYKSKITPYEVLLCIPKKYYKKVIYLKKLCKIILTCKKGQVYQRSIGFRFVKGDLVLQLDDDILVKPNTLGLLVKGLISLGQGNVVGPVLIDKRNGRPIHAFREGLPGVMQTIYCKLFAGAKWGAKRMGQVTSIGVNYGIDPAYFPPKKAIETQWLSGGCVLSYKKDLLLKNFFPFSGKAFCEDIIHSLYRSQNGIRHWVIPEARASTDLPASFFALSDWEKLTKARSFYTKIKNGSKVKSSIYNFIFGVHQIIRSIKQIINFNKNS